jgi:hypothetical protein
VRLTASGAPDSVVALGVYVVVAGGTSSSPWCVASAKSPGEPLEEYYSKFTPPKSPTNIYTQTDSKLETFKILLDEVNRVVNVEIHKSLVHGTMMYLVDVETAPGSDSAPSEEVEDTCLE